MTDRPTKDPSQQDKQSAERVHQEAMRILTNARSWDVGERGSGSASASLPLGSDDQLKLRSGSRIAVIGGGPAGTLFTHFLLKTMRRLGTNIEIDIYEPRNFAFCGPAGCNHCGGVVSESLVQILGTEGIVLPNETVQRGIDSYVMHMDVGSVRIETPLQEKRIAAVYRGNGPRQCEPATVSGFDHHLLQRAQDAGAQVIPRMVTGVRMDQGRPLLTCAGGRQQSYDLLVVASGINSAMLGLIEGIDSGFIQPVAAKSFVAEFKLGAAAIEASLGTSMHVFLLDLPHLQFAALIPKGDYLTLVMLGDKVDQELIEAFINAPEVSACFPGAKPPTNVCQCFPRLNIAHARKPYTDRVVFIGDSGVARLFKDGIGSAYRSAKAAANCVALYGISEADFRRHYWPACRAIVIDNAIGRLVFGFCHLIQKLQFARRMVLRMTVNEQQRAGAYPHMSSVLWDIFTGSAPYREVLLRTLHPGFLIRLGWNLLAANLRRPRRRTEGLSPS